jgi:hypothetical protein
MISIVSVMDIVERLRVPIWTLEYDTERKEAANEIERLRAALRAILDDPETGVNAALYAKTALGDA